MSIKVGRTPRPSMKNSTAGQAPEPAGRQSQASATPSVVVMDCLSRTVIQRAVRKDATGTTRHFGIGCDLARVQRSNIVPDV
jgi:hypothetical protein